MDRIWQVVPLWLASVAGPAQAQSNANACVEVARDSLRPAVIAINAANAEESAEAGIPAASRFISFTSDYGFVYNTIGLPIIGEHYPFTESVPNQIRVDRNTTPNASINSVIVTRHSTNNAGIKTFYGISNQTSTLILLGIAFLTGMVAVRAQNIVAAFVGKDSDWVKHLFWVGFAVGFFGGIFVIDDIKDAFGPNTLVYFDNAGDTPAQIVINNQKTATIAANENIGVYLGRGRNDLDVLPSADGAEAWCGNIYVRGPEGYLVFNIGAKNHYNVRTAAWGK